MNERFAPGSLEAALGYAHSFAHVTDAEGTRFEFAFESDLERWPWLRLPPQHPVVIDKVQYFSAITAGWTAKLWKAGTRSALTAIRWNCLVDDAEPSVRGVYRGGTGDNGMGYELDLFDAEGRHTTHIEGDGAAFGDRDFGAWRAEAKRKLAALPAPSVPDMADPSALGLGPGGQSLVSPLRELDGERVSIGWVTRDNGFPPRHPFHTGSGDHVNAAHLFDCALQASHLVLEAANPLRCTGGEARFRRFVELGVPFLIRASSVVRKGGGAASLCLTMSQGDRDNASVDLELVPG